MIMNDQGLVVKGLGGILFGLKLAKTLNPLTAGAAFHFVLAHKYHI